MQELGETNCWHWPRQWHRPVSSPLFELLQSEGFFATIVGAISLCSRKLSGFAFVNDTDLCVMHPSNDIVQVAKHMQGLVFTWEGLLWATGGALVPDKCFWYLINFDHKNRKWHYSPWIVYQGHCLFTMTKACKLQFQDLRYQRSNAL